jgi:alcohol dehydrogenase, propanol-preferring
MSGGPNCRSDARNGRSASRHVRFLICSLCPSSFEVFDARLPSDRSAHDGTPQHPPTGARPQRAVQILPATTASRIVAVDVREEALQLAREIGANYTIRSNDDTVRAIRDLVGPSPGGLDVVLDCVGSQATVDIARAVVTAGGDIAIVGLGGGALPVGFGTIAMEARVSVPFWGTRAELAKVIALAQAGRIRAHVDQFSLTDVGQAYDRLRAGRLNGRAVVVPGARAS